jgi:hypothetical protein
MPSMSCCPASGDEACPGLVDVASEPDCGETIRWHRDEGVGELVTLVGVTLTAISSRASPAASPSSCPSAPTPPRCAPTPT